ncbi:polyhydroxyalkanoate granule-associated phasin [Deefgea sp. CFH1-16]|uniref:polyhydroxyalkanoate granule-associated phasin n=1 Tax=Deefgea sp. CFH1-16 TaxID=2675457 RepID=UPI0015F48F31|nr:polyhydroxyalkanoate granule-associated phasin [Deefgea sp. CFH1-16]MBM5575519.1 hypothetical protein [Deefgea sp. CFH1-16]
MTQLTQDPFATWHELAQKTQEMWLDSAFVFSQRTQMLAQAGMNPNAAEQAEMTQMGMEKLEAVGESSVAALQQIGAMQQALWAKALQQNQAAIALVTASMASPQAALAAQQQYSYQLLSPELLTQASADMAHAILHPVHKRTTENAERLREEND